MNFDSEFKKALQLLPAKEKDKLILRLLKHDLVLANRLRFELVDTDSIEDKREEVKNRLVRRIQEASEKYYSPGYLLMDLREVSGEINEHVSVTKDKVGEILLNCSMLCLALEYNNKRIMEVSRGKCHTLCIYVIARVFKILILIQKQHEDLHLEFKEELETMGRLMGANDRLMEVAIANGLDVNWLIQFNIPGNIADIHKELRNNGFLK